MLGPRTGRRAQSGYDIFFLRQPDSRVQHAIAAKPSANLTSLCLSPTGDQWATIQRFHAEVCVYDRNPKIQPPRLNLHDLIWFWDIGWLDRQHLLALATARTARGNPGSEERIVIWDTSTGQIVQSRTNPSAMDVLAIAPDGRRFAESGTGRRVCIRDAATLTVVQEFRAHNDRISALAWHPHRPVIATASEDLSVKLWNLETGQPLQELRGPITPPVRLAFSPSGRRLGCASPNDAVRIWEVE
jgi:WD40 repeat protein